MERCLRRHPFRRAALTPENLRNDILAKYGDLAAYNPQIPYDYIVYYGTSLTPSKEFA